MSRRSAVGAWLLARRGWLPVPVLVAALGLPPRLWLPGGLMMVAGEALRLWAVGHIGLPSRTRDEGVGPLVTTGPYAVVRNPLYVGNILLWTGFGVVLWPAALVLFPLFAVYYELIVRWEEERVAATHGEAWRAYAARVSRWWPRWSPEAAGRWSARVALRTERGTFVVIAGVLLLLALRA